MSETRACMADPIVPARLSTSVTMRCPLTDRVVLATDRHIQDAQEWLVGYGAPRAPLWIFSDSGYVVPGVAAVWLYLTNSGLGFLESIIGNPAISAQERSDGLDAVIARAIEEAQAFGVQTLCVYPQKAHVEDRLLRHGFSVFGRGMSLVGLPLAQEVRR